MFESVTESAAKLFDTLTNGSGNHLTPVAVLSINGTPFGSGTMSRIISVQLTDNRGFESDELTIDLEDSDGLLAIPPQDSLIRCWLGFKETGVVYKGEYKMSEFTHSGAPDKLSITARAADLAESLAEQQEKSWHKQTLYQIVETIAKKHGYEYLIGEDYKTTAIDHIDQTNESDASFLTRLATQYDAIATVKDGKLLFLPVGEAKTASGTDITPVDLRRTSGDSHSFTYSSTNNYSAVRAYYTAAKSGKKMSVLITKENAYPVRKTVTKTVGKKKKKTVTKRVLESKTVSAEGEKIKTLRHLYATKAGAESGARAAFRKIKRGMASFKINLAVGRPDLYPETPINVAGFKADIDGESWIATRVSHSLGDSGYTASLELEALLQQEKL